MRRVTTVLVLVWAMLFVDESNENEQQERAELLAWLGGVVSLNLPYPRHYEHPSEDVLNQMPIDDLRRYVQTTNEDIPCRYVYHALQHNWLVKRSFHFDLTTLKTVIDLTFDFSALFRVQLRKTMRKIVEDGPADLGDLMWIYYTYTEMFHEYWLTCSNDKGNVEMEKVWIAHSHAGRLLIEYLRSDRCADYYRTQTDKSQSVKRAHGDNDDRFWLYSVKFEKRYLEWANPARGTDSASVGGELSMKMLRLNDVLADQDVVWRIYDCFFVGFDWQVVVAQATERPCPLADYRTASLSSQIKTVAMVENDFVEVCKVIFLRNVLDYLVGAGSVAFYNLVGQVNIDDFLTEHNAKMAKHITELVDFLKITYGPQVQTVLKTFGGPVVIFKHNARVKRGVKHLILTLKIGILALLFNGSKLFESLTIGNDDKRTFIQHVGRYDTGNTDDMLRLIRHAESRTADFVALIKDKFRGIEFKMINSYARVRVSKVFTFLENLETSKE